MFLIIYTSQFFAVYFIDRLASLFITWTLLLSQK